MNNRLDFISEFDNHDDAIIDMSRIRKEFIALDEKVLEIWKSCGNQEGQRAASIARTKIESALHYTIKALCLKYEKKA